MKIVSQSIGVAFRSNVGRDARELAPVPRDLVEPVTHIHVLGLSPGAT